MLDHEVTEHEDDTITASPSILGAYYHGYLNTVFGENARWRA